MSNLVSIVGVGALGSHLCLLLRNLDIKLRLIDFDLVEQKNTLSQFHAKQSIRKNKTIALQQTMQFLFGNKNIETIPHKLTNDNEKELLSADLVIDCLDNAASRRIIQQFVRKNNISCLHGALSADTLKTGRVVWDEMFIIDEESSPGAATCENGDQLPFIVITASYLAYSAQEFLQTGRKKSYHVFPSGVSRI